MSEQSVMTTPIFDELVNELGTVAPESATNQAQDNEQKDTNR